MGWIGVCVWTAAGGYLLALRGKLASLPGWIAILVGGLCVAAFAVRYLRRSGAKKSAHPDAQPGLDHGPSKWLEALFAVGIGSVFLCGLITALGSAPSCWDVLTYHLARVGYYLQQGTLDDFHANYWAQEQHGRLSAILFSATLVLTGFSDRGIGLWQLTAWAVILIEGYQLSRMLGFGPKASRAAGATIGLFTVAAMEAPTAQNDLLITSFLGLGAIGIMGYLWTGAPLRLAYGAMSVAFAVGVKASALTLAPSLFFLALAATWHSTDLSNRRPWKRLGHLCGAIALCCLLVSAPAGYIKNWRVHGNPLGGDAVMRHADQQGPWFRLTALNLGRFVFDFCTLDGLPESWGGSQGGKIKAMASASLASIGFDLESPVGRRSSFESARERMAHSDLSYFGVLGPALVLPALLLCWRFGSSPTLRDLAIAAGVFFVTQAGIGRYDHWRGRHFIYVMVMLAPLIAWLHARSSRAARGYVAAASVLGVISALTAVLWRVPNPLVSHDVWPSILSLDRDGQMLTSEEDLPAIRRFDKIVSPTATVALAIGPDEHEYALFGRSLTRRLYPVAYTLPNLVLPSPCDFLLFGRNLGVPPELGDIDLGYRWILRRLPPSGFSALPPGVIAPATEPRLSLQGLLVQRLHAPAEIQWALDGTERELSFDFGFIPEAYERGASNGVEFFVEVQSPDGSRQIVFRRFLNPASQAGDRGNQTARVALAEVRPGNRLVLRTDPGPYGDNAWDWSYVTRMQVQRAIAPRQGHL